MADQTSLVACKALHDRLLAEKPDGANHDEKACPLCAMTTVTAEGNDTNDPRGGSMSDKTYTEDDLKAAVDAATAQFAARIKDLEASHQESEVEAAVSAAKAEADERIKELQTELDAKVLEAAAEKQRADEITAWLEEEQTKAEQAAEIAARKNERLDAVKAAVKFPEDYLEKNADRFAAMSDEDFAVALEGFKAALAKTDDSPIPSKTALLAGLESTDTGKPTSAAKALIAARRSSGRVDLTSL